CNATVRFCHSGRASDVSGFNQNSGIGPRIALAVLSGMSTDDLANAVEEGNLGLLTRIPGIGKKTAERLVLELKGKLSITQSGSTTPTTAASAQTDIISALIALGYSEREAVSAAKKLPADVSVSEGIRQALKVLAR
ncbi:Holliday junction DNA helicase RuvA, partial [gut metagenome]